MAMNDASYSVFNAGEARRAAIEAQRGNTGQFATVALSYTTTGTGYLQTEEPLSLTASYVDEPGFASGTAQVAGPAGSATAGVHKWVKNARGLYVAAYLWFQIAGAKDTVLVHSIVLHGYAIKMLPESATKTLKTIHVRVPNVF